ncbi:MAG: zf-HC2 domain-containing protein [Candidatus Krumholzibacteriota bacterium]|nr:zf-HC2 domain-containing protein [Candidatus Krumholzibacteriota bacterium]
MNCTRMECDGMRYLDGEMGASEKMAFERHLEGCETCRAAVEELGGLEKELGAMQIRDPIDEFWEGYWRGIYRRLERRFSWWLVVGGLLMIAAYIVYETVRNFGQLTFGKTALVVLAVGVLGLFVSVVRERVHQCRSDRYRDIQR